MIPIHDDNPVRITPYVNWTIIAVCVVVYLWQISHDAAAQQALVYGLGLIPAVFLGDLALPPELYRVPPLLTLFTSMFMHGGLLHLLGNMLYLWIFGNNVEDAMGHARFVLFYLLCGIGAAMAQALPNPEAQIPMIGASGAISGVLGAYLLLYPHARVLVAIPLGFYVHTVYLPAMLVLGAWFAIQALSSLGMNPAEGGVAWYAHLGGFVIGLLLIPLFRHRTVRLWQGRRR